MKNRSIIICALLLLVFSSPALAFLMNNSSSRLYQSDVGSAARTDLGDMGSFSATDIAYDGSTVYAITFSNFYHYNPVTSTTTSYGSHGQSGLNALTYDYGGGVLYGAGTSGNFGSMTTGGTFTYIGDYGTYNGNNISSSGDLSFFTDGNLYATVGISGYSNDYLATINTSTGAATIIGSLGYTNVYGLFVEDSLLYGLRDDGDLLRIDPVTAATTFIRDYRGSAYWGAAGDDASLIPEPTTLLIFGTGMILGFAGVRRKTKKHRAG